MENTMEKIMEGELDADDDDAPDAIDPFAGIDMQAAMAQAQQMQQAAMAQAQAIQAQMAQAMQGIDMGEYMKNIQNMMATMMGTNAPAKDEEENK